MTGTRRLSIFCEYSIQWAHELQWLELLSIVLVLYSFIFSNLGARDCWSFPYLIWSSSFITSPFMCKVINRWLYCVYIFESTKREGEWEQSRHHEKVFGMTIQSCYHFSLSAENVILLKFVVIQIKLNIVYIIIFIRSFIKLLTDIFVAATLCFAFGFKTLKISL